MKKIAFYFLIILLYGCSSDSNISITDPSAIEYQWIIPKGKITGNFGLFPLAQNPTFNTVSDVNSLPDNTLVAVVNIKNEIKVYPYEYIRNFESINDNINGQNIAMTYCPITKSSLCWNTDFNQERLVLRASGYLLNENIVLYDKKSDTYWSQMFSSSIKGKYAEQSNTVFNSIETTWGTVKNNFKNALVFTNTSISNSKASTNKASLKDIEDGDRIYGIIEKRAKSNAEIHIYKYEEFKNEIKIFQNQIGASKIIVVGSEKHHFITSYINDTNTTFTPIQNSFPIVMKDSDGNQWDVFGIAQSGSREGQQLQSPTGFIALWWAWEAFYDDFVFNE